MSRTTSPAHDTSPTRCSSCTPARSSSRGRRSRCSQEPLHPVHPAAARVRAGSGGHRTRADRHPQGPRVRRRRPAGGLPLRRPLPARGSTSARRSHPSSSRRDPAHSARCHVTAPVTRHRKRTSMQPVHQTVPGRLRLGHRDRVVPDRRRRQRGRPRRERLGPLLRDARQGAERRHRRGRVRLLPPLPRRHRADARARPRRVPLLDRVAAGHPDGPRGGQRRRGSTSTTASSTSCSATGSRRS